MNCDRFQWISVDFNASRRIVMDFNGFRYFDRLFRWSSTDFKLFQRISEHFNRFNTFQGFLKDLFGFQWILDYFDGFSWISTDFGEFERISDYFDGFG